MRAERKQIALISSGAEHYRKYLLEQLSEAYDVWLVSDEQVTWQQPFIQGSSKVDDYEPDTLERAVADVRQIGKVAGLVCWDERYIIATADVAARLGLPSAGPQGIRGCRDKALSRALLSAAGVRQPTSKLCGGIDEAVEYARTLSFPLIVKPRGMGASIGVALVNNEAELRERYAKAYEASFQGAKDFHSGVLIEEFIEGPEISVDGRVVNGAYEPLFVARKSVGLPPHFEEVGHVVRHDDPLLYDAELRRTLTQAHYAVGFQNGITHTELKLTPEGPVIIEINGRLGGDLIPFLATLALGLQPGRLAGQIACGEANDPEERPLRGAAAIRFRYPEEDLTVANVILPRPVQREALEGHSASLVTFGTRLALPPSAHAARAAYSIAVGRDAQACVALSQELSDSIVIERIHDTPPVSTAQELEVQR